jgi:hypothetical protein
LKSKRLKLLQELYEIDDGEMLDALIETICIRKVNSQPRVAEADRETRDKAADYLDAVRKSIARARGRGRR